MTLLVNVIIEPTLAFYPAPAENYHELIAEPKSSVKFTNKLPVL